MNSFQTNSIFQTRQYSPIQLKDAFKQKRCVSTTALQAKLTKRSRKQPLLKSRGVMVDPRAGLCLSKNGTFLFIMSQLFICGLKTKDIFLFFPQFFFTQTTILSNFFFVSTISVFLVLFSSMIESFEGKRERTLHGGKKKFNFFGREKLRFFFDLNNIMWFVT